MKLSGERRAKAGRDRKSRIIGKQKVDKLKGTD
jgi:hypothetical protein